jgi:hypothetical protein
VTFDFLEKGLKVCKFCFREWGVLLREIIAKKT